MKTIFVIFFATLFCYINGYSQSIVYPTHLFYGQYSSTTDKDKTTEIWEISDEGELVGKTIYEYQGGSMLSETMRIINKENELQYCATILEQDTENPQGEICFTLKNYKDEVFIFENLNHDFPKRIIYDFSGFGTVNARVEGDTSGFDIMFIREYTNLPITIKGKIFKQPFENRAGKIIEGVYDYFLNIQGINYFIKIGKSYINISELETLLDKEITYSVVFNQGLWDADDNNQQSRVGKYVIISKLD